MAQQLQPQTRSGLLPEARHLILPAGIRSSGFPSVRETCRSIGIQFDRWQQDLNKCLLAKDAQGLYAADTAVLSIARQVGKTYDIGAVAFALCIAIPGLTVVWTAHRFKVARESFNEMRAWAKSPLLVPHIDFDDITTGAGNECIPFRNGSRIVFAARERGAIRGFTKVGMLVLDEAQILTEAALSDLVPTTNQAPNPLIILMGTPPKSTDPGEVFIRLRAEALAGESDDVLYVELSADPNADPDDRRQWRKANLSYPTRTPARAMLRLRKLLSREDFLREGLGIWPDDAAKQWQVLAKDEWRAADRGPTQPGARPRAVMGSQLALGVWVSPDRRRAAIGAAGDRMDVAGGRLVELTHDDAGYDVRPDTSWVVPRVRELCERNRPLVVVTNDRVLADQAPELLYLAQGPDLSSSAGMLYDGIRDDSVRHLGQPDLTSAVAGAAKRTSGRGWVWESAAGVDVCPVGAVSLALWGLLTPRVHAPRKAAVPTFAHV